MEDPRSARQSSDCKHKAISPMVSPEESDTRNKPQAIEKTAEELSPRGNLTGRVRDGKEKGGAKEEV